MMMKKLHTGITVVTWGDLRYLYAPHGGRISRVWSCRGGRAYITRTWVSDLLTRKHEVVSQRLDRMLQEGLFNDDEDITLP